MDLSFLTGNASPQVGAFQWAGNNQNPGMMNFNGSNTPALNYNPGATIGMPSNTSPMTSFASQGGAGLTGQLGMNLPTLQLGLGAIGSLGNLAGAFSASKLAKDQFNFTKDVTNTNLNNQIKSYNTALEDRARSRAAAENRDQSSADEYVNRNRMTR